MRKYKVFFIYLSILTSLLPAFLFGDVDTAWVRRYNGIGYGQDSLTAMTVDNSGNIYVTGASHGSGSNLDYATVKYNTNGDIIWVRRYDGPVNDFDLASAITVDSAGNVYVTGYSTGFGVNRDYLTIKYYANGDTGWIRRYNGPNNSIDIASAIITDNSGNVIVTGWSGFFPLVDFVTIKYNANGDTVWLRRYNGTPNGQDMPYAMTIDSVDNIYITGPSRSSGTNFNYATLKYNSNGNLAWQATYDGPASQDDYSKAIAIDNTGNVCVTGYDMNASGYKNYATVKYNASGIQQWVARYNSITENNMANAIAIDDDGNVYVTGTGWGAGSYDYMTIKYNSSGDEQWVQRYNGSANSYDEAYTIAAGEQTNIYITGVSYGAGTGADFVTIKYNSAGVEQWTARYNGSGNDTDGASAIAVRIMQNVYVAGSSIGSGTGSDYAIVKYIQTPNIEQPIENCKLIIDNYSLFPNPAKTYFTIRLPQTMNQVQNDICIIKIFDVTGKEVREILNQVQNDNTLRISLDGIKNGIYFIKVGNEMLKEKLVILR